MTKLLPITPFDPATATFMFDKLNEMIGEINNLNERIDALWAHLHEMTQKREEEA